MILSFLKEPQKIALLGPTLALNRPRKLNKGRAKGPLSLPGIGLGEWELGVVVRGTGIGQTGLEVGILDGAVLGQRTTERHRALLEGSPQKGRSRAEPTGLAILPKLWSDYSF